MVEVSGVPPLVVEGSWRAWFWHVAVAGSHWDRSLVEDKTPVRAIPVGMIGRGGQLKGFNPGFLVGNE